MSEADTDGARGAIAAPGGGAKTCGQSKAELPALEQAHVHAPDDAAATVRLAQAYTAAGEPAKAVPLVLPLATGARPDARALLAQGDAEAALGQRVAAVASYRRGVAADPAESNAIACGEGVLALSPADALALFQEQVRVHAESAHLWADLGASQITMGREAAAAQSLLHASALDSDAVLPVVLMAQLHGLPPEVSRAVAELIQTYVVAHPESAQAHASYALSLWKQAGEAPGAQTRPVLLAELRRALALDPKMVEARRLLGLVEQQAGDARAAAADLEAALQQEPQDATARYHLALVYRDLGQGAKANELLQQFRLLQQQPSPLVAGARALCP